MKIFLFLFLLNGITCYVRNKPALHIRFLGDCRLQSRTGTESLALDSNSSSLTATTTTDAFSAAKNYLKNGPYQSSVLSGLRKESVRNINAVSGGTLGTRLGETSGKKEIHRSYQDSNIRSKPTKQQSSPDVIFSTDLGFQRHHSHTHSNVQPGAVRASRQGTRQGSYQPSARFPGKSSQDDDSMIRNDVRGVRGTLPVADTASTNQQVRRRMQTRRLSGRLTLSGANRITSYQNIRRDVQKQSSDSLAYPTHFSRTLYYDHLAMTSLDAIEISYPGSGGRVRKGKSYLGRWWMAAKKWNILCDELLELEKEYNAQLVAQGLSTLDDLIAAKKAAGLDGESLDLEPVEDNEFDDDFDLQRKTTRERQGEEEEEQDTTEQSEDSGILYSDQSGVEEDRREESMPQSDDDFSDTVVPGDDDLAAGESIGGVLGDDDDADDDGDEEDGVRGGQSEGTSTDNDDDGISGTVRAMDYGTVSTAVHPPSWVNDPISRLKDPLPSDGRGEMLDHSKIPIDELLAVCARHRARVIVIGDVHGCVEEFKDLLRAAKYLPGDVVLLLGDLVAKGPNSTDVIRMAMDINAQSVRGNHDHEVVRQLYKYRENLMKGDNEPYRCANARLQEHLDIAMHLSVREFRWLSELPFYIKCPELGSVFVHAGFRSDKRLAEQDPWVMMTARSLLPDGRMSPRCFHSYPWAHNWRGPLTVFFGHDAARGLQTYECANGLDTGCVYGGELTALLLPEKRFVSVPAREAYQPYGKSRSHRLFEQTKQNGSSEARAVKDSVSGYAKRTAAGPVVSTVIGDQRRISETVAVGSLPSPTFFPAAVASYVRSQPAVRGHSSASSGASSNSAGRVSAYRNAEKDDDGADEVVRGTSKIGWDESIDEEVIAIFADEDNDVDDVKKQEEVDSAPIKELRKTIEKRAKEAAVKALYDRQQPQQQQQQEENDVGIDAKMNVNASAYISQPAVISPTVGEVDAVEAGKRSTSSSPLGTIKTVLSTLTNGSVADTNGSIHGSETMKASRGSVSESPTEVNAVAAPLLSPLDGTSATKFDTVLKEIKPQGSPSEISATTSISVSSTVVAGASTADNDVIPDTSEATDLQPESSSATGLEIANRDMNLGADDADGDSEGDANTVLMIRRLAERLNRAMEESERVRMRVRKVDLRPLTRTLLDVLGDDGRESLEEMEDIWRTLEDRRDALEALEEVGPQLEMKFGSPAKLFVDASRIAGKLPEARIKDLIRQYGDRTSVEEWFTKRRRPSREEYIAQLLDVLGNRYDNDYARVIETIELTGELASPKKKAGFGFGAAKKPTWLSTEVRSDDIPPQTMSNAASSVPMAVTVVAPTIELEFDSDEEALAAAASLGANIISIATNEAEIADSTRVSVNAVDTTLLEENQSSLSLDTNQALLSKNADASDNSNDLLRIIDRNMVNGEVEDFAASVNAAGDDEFDASDIDDEDDGDDDQEEGGDDSQEEDEEFPIEKQKRTSRKKRGSNQSAIDIENPRYSENQDEDELMRMLLDDGSAPKVLEEHFGFSGPLEEFDPEVYEEMAERVVEEGMKGIDIFGDASASIDTTGVEEAAGVAGGSLAFPGTPTRSITSDIESSSPREFPSSVTRRSGSSAQEIADSLSAYIGEDAASGTSALSAQMLGNEVEGNAAAGTEKRVSSSVRGSGAPTSAGSDRTTAASALQRKSIKSMQDQIGKVFGGGGKLVQDLANLFESDATEESIKKLVQLTNEIDSMFGENMSADFFQAAGIASTFSEAQLKELIETHREGVSDDVLPEDIFMKRRNFSKEEYVAMLLDVLGHKYEKDFFVVRQILEDVSHPAQAKKSKGFGKSSSGAGGAAGSGGGGGGGGGFKGFGKR